MKTRTGILLVAVCASVLMAGTAVPQSIASSRSAGAHLNLGLATDQPIWQLGTTAIFNVRESGQGRDLNGDGDLSDAPLHVFDATSGEVRNLGLDGVALPFMQGRLVVLAADEHESVPGDLNGDGDATDFLLHIADLSTLTTRNTGLSGAFTYRAEQSPLLPPSNGTVFLPVREDRQGRDLNGDGDLADMVLQVIDVRSGTSRSTGFAIASVPSNVTGARRFTFVFEVPLLIRGQAFESALVLENGVDLNADGDTQDLVLHFFDLATGEVTNTGLAAGTPAGNELGPGLLFAFAGLDPGASLQTVTGLQPAPRAGTGPGLGDAFAFLVSEAAQGHVDLNGDGDTNDLVVHATRLTDRDRDGRLDFTESSTAR